jgi:hypothetical protein
MIVQEYGGGLGEGGCGASSWPWEVALAAADAAKAAAAQVEGGGYTLPLAHIATVPTLKHFDQACFSHTIARSVRIPSFTEDRLVFLWPPHERGSLQHRGSLRMAKDCRPVLNSKKNYAYTTSCIHDIICSCAHYPKNQILHLTT